MEKKIKAKVWKFGNDIDTDLITPGKYLGTAELNDHVLATEDPEFPKEVKQGDVVVAGKNFGCGSSRETAPEALLKLGIVATFCESYARIYYRNSVGLGLPPLIVPGVSTEFEKGDELEFSYETFKVKNLRTGKELQAESIPDFLLEILEGGGQEKILKKKLKQKVKELRAKEKQ
ncbi:MAG: 3-isopropylmalate dehydratase [Candidatus Helarchaeota archaeon]|nr:3-isopropylmalate dehydratase [Candidatus Helarchaeota archaeon]